MGKPIFGYWEARGVSQPIRFILAYLQVDYQEIRYKLNDGGAEWFEKDKLKLELDFPNLPYWIDDNGKLTESRAILKYIARVYGKDVNLDPSENQFEEAKIHMLECVLYELWWDMKRLCNAYTAELRVEFDKLIQPKLVQVSRYLGNSAFILGSKISYLDFLLYEVLYQYLKFDENYLKATANLKSFKRRFEELPEMKAYIESERYIAKPVVNPFKTKYNKINE